MTNTNQPYSPKGIIKTMTILHYAYCIAIIVFGTVTLFITENTNINFADTEDLFFYLVPAAAIAAPIFGNFIFKSLLKGIHQKTTLKEKLISYQSARLIRIAFLEAPALLGIVIFMITSNQFYLVISVVLLAYLILLRPTLSTIKEDLDLNSEQEREFREALK